MSVNALTIYLPECQIRL